MKTFSSAKWDVDADHDMFQELFKKNEKKSKLMRKAKDKLKQTRVDKKTSNKLYLKSDDTINLINAPPDEIKKKLKRKEQTAGAQSYKKLSYVKSVERSVVSPLETQKTIKSENNKYSKVLQSKKPSKLEKEREILTKSKKRRMRKLKKPNNNELNKKNESNSSTEETIELEVLKCSKGIPESLKKIKKNEKLVGKIETKYPAKGNSMATKSLGFNGDKRREKFFGKLKAVLLEDAKERKPRLSLRQRMMEKLKAARFRFINEQIYTSDSKGAQKLFRDDPGAFEAYHDGYRKQVRKWPMNPLDAIIKSVKMMPKTHVVADFGCGDARLSKSVDQKVHSFDLVAVDATVTECDMRKVPLGNNSVDVAVFCLSLMGTNLKDYLLEANRVLRTGGVLKIAEVESRFDNVDEFIEGATRFGFRNAVKDLTNNLFYFLDFVKEKEAKRKNKLPTVALHPCLYKKR